MKICWDNLRDLRYIKKKNIWRDLHGNTLLYVEECEYCKDPFLAIMKKGVLGKCCSKKCARSGIKRSEEAIEKTRLKNIGRVQSDETRRKIGVANTGKKWSDERKKKMSDARRGKNTGEAHHAFGKKMFLSDKRKEQLHLQFSGKNNPRWSGGFCSRKIVSYSRHGDSISWCDNIRADPLNNEDLQTQCTYCGKWFTPSLADVFNRIYSINKEGVDKNRLYCSDECKHLCPIFRKFKYSDEEHNKNIFSREVQPQLRQIVFERDNWTCIKCNGTNSLQCHHIEGIRWEPLESADIDKCITVCKDCHEEIHKMEGCRKSDMKCEKLEGENDANSTSS